MTAETQKLTSTIGNEKWQFRNDVMRADVRTRQAQGKEKWNINE
jgi:hypothetical protein